MNAGIFRTVSILFLFTSLNAGAQTTVFGDGEIDEKRAAEFHEEFDFRDFKNHPKASAPIDFEDIDYDLLSAAVFHETNRRRADHDLPLFGYRHELRRAARIQADGMAQTETVTHQHPDERLRTLGDRLEHQELVAAFSAENVALSFAIQYEEGTSVVPDEEDGTTVFRYELGDDPIEPHTYHSYAETLLDQWMDSPEHRKNILHEEPEMLGTGHVHGKNSIDMDVFYSVQVFFTELEVPPGAEVIQEPN